MFTTFQPKDVEQLPLSKMNYAGLGKIMMKEMLEEEEAPPLIAFLKGARKNTLSFLPANYQLIYLDLSKKSFILKSKLSTPRFILKML